MTLNEDKEVKCEYLISGNIVNYWYFKRTIKNKSIWILTRNLNQIVSNQISNQISNCASNQMSNWLGVSNWVSNWLWVNSAKWYKTC